MANPFSLFKVACSTGQVRQHPAYLDIAMALVLILSYIADWLVLAVLAAASAVMGRVTPIHRPFSLSDENISCVLSSPRSPACKTLTCAQFPVYGLRNRPNLLAGGR